tara:strand:- start:2320 stop:2901 length:582 start_codon:yes stop_codon:yes gene_type:complete
MINIRFFLTVLIFIFNIQFSSKADNIKEFEIEGMSLGDSALNFFSEKDIINNSKDFYRDKTFTPVQNDLYPFFKTYDAVDFNFLTGDKKYIFHNISGILFYDNNIQDCYSKMDSITLDIKQNIKYLKHHLKTENKHRADKTGKSKFTETRFDLKDGFIGIICYDYSVEYGNQDHLSVYIDTKKFHEWALGDVY